MNYNIKNQAKQYIGQGLAVFPLAANTKKPLKGSHGYKDATTDPKDVDKWPDNINLAIRLKDMIVVDVDRHSAEADGVKSIAEWKKSGFSLPTKTYIEQTPNNGFHIFYKANSVKPVKKQAVMPGIDLISDFIVVSPSAIDGKPYKVLGATTIDEAVNAPNWLVAMLKRRKHFTKADYKAVKSFSSRLVNDLAKGADQGERNAWLTHVAGMLIATHAKAESIYRVLAMVNQFEMNPPLKDEEVLKIFSSVLREEVAKDGSKNESY